MKRRALLIGVTEYDAPELRLEVVERDVAAMVRALQAAGVPGDNIEEATGNLSAAQIKKNIREFLEKCEGDDAVIYFSGHGAEDATTRALIPGDYDLEDPRPLDDLPDDHSLYGRARSSRARSVIYLIDACRVGVELRLAAATKATSTSVGKPTEKEEKGASVILIWSCARGERSFVEKGPDGLSRFTRALCQTFETDDDQAGVEELVAAIRERVTKSLGGGQKQTVTIDERRAHGRSGDPLQIILKENATARLRQRMKDSSWCQSLKEIGLFGIVATENNLLAESVLAVALGAEETCAKLRVKGEADRWTGEDAPIRLLRHLDRLVNAGDGEAPLLDGSNAALALAVPFVYEAVLAVGQLNLVRTDEDDPGDVLRRAWEMHRSAAEFWESRLRSLDRREKGEARDDVLAWRRQNFLHQIGNLWRYEPEEKPGAFSWLPEALSAVFRSFPPAMEDPRIAQLLTGQRLVRMARLLPAASEAIEDERQGAVDDWLDPAHPLVHGEMIWRIDQTAVAHLLALAARMALDPRRMPKTIVEHLGVDPKLTLEHVTAAFSRATWVVDESGRRLSLHLDCDHPVIDQAIELATADLEAQRQDLARRWEATERARTIRLPLSFDTEQVRPRKNSYGPVYQRPHLTFALNSDRVRGLLMGVNLYGKPEIALRELYQNAIDACRYRRARDAFLAATVGKSGAVYRGAITFRFGESDDGRPYVECEDDGIGMESHHFRIFFAQAGERFVDSHDFQLEKAEWDAAGVTFFPNSRFGIGVFSYFMLADELEVKTRRAKRIGSPGNEGLIAHIVGAGGIFHLQRRDFGVRPYGTLVRLYLNEKAPEGGALLDSIGEWLWLPPIETRLINIDGEEQVLTAGELTSEALRRIDREVVPIPADPAIDPLNQSKAYWILPKRPERATGILLVDGVRVGATSFEHVLANWSGSEAPTLSVDRRRVQEDSAARVWTARTLHESGTRALLHDERVNLIQLTHIFREYPELRLRANLELRGAEEPIMKSLEIDRSFSKIDIRRTGLDSRDDEIVEFFLRSIDQPKTGQRDTEFLAAEWPRWRLGMIVKNSLMSFGVLARAVKFLIEDQTIEESLRLAVLARALAQVALTSPSLVGLCNGAKEDVTVAGDLVRTEHPTESHVDQALYEIALADVLRMLGHSSEIIDWKFAEEYQATFAWSELIVMAHRKWSVDDDGPEIALSSLGETYRGS